MSHGKHALTLVGICTVLLATAVASLCDTSAADPSPIRVDYSFDVPSAVPKTDGTHRVEVPGLKTWGPIGAPVLPYETCRILLPPGVEVTEIYIAGPTWRRLSGSYSVEAGQQPIPLSRQGPHGPTPPDPGVYSSDSWFPEQPYSDYSIQRWRGHEILIVNVFPVRYLPSSGELQWCEFLSVTVSLRPATAAEAARRLATSTHESDLGYLRRHVDNPQQLEDYAISREIGQAVGDSALDPFPSYEYVVITDASLDTSGPNTLQALVAQKQSDGMTAGIVHTDWIYSTYSGDRPDGGSDNQTRIRNFIIDAYNTWGTRYVLLAGDADPVDVGGESGDLLVPHRGLTIDAGFEADYDIPSDLYYGCLDGTFDYDADGDYGEPTDGPGGGDVDLLAEVHIGRAPVDSLQEVSAFVAKQFAYASAAPPRDIWMVGEYLGFGGVAEWGGNLKDEIKDGADIHGYATVGFLDALASPTYDVYTLYDRDDPGSDWPASDVIDVINQGSHVINHMGHANVTYVMKLVNSDVDALTNSSYIILYSQGCYCGSFDNRDSYPDSYYSEDCISEHLTCETHGAVAVIANSRYGWGVVGSTDGPSQHFDREFWDAVLGELILEIGPANDDSKWDQVGYIGLDLIGRWCAYETNLFGDPQLCLRIGVSSWGSISLDRSAYPIGDTADIMVLDLDLDSNPGAPDSVSISIVSTTEAAPETVMCTETGNSTAMFAGAIGLVSGSPSSDGQLQVAHGDTITVTYIDADNGSGGVDVVNTDTATVDAMGPTFAGLESALPADGYVSLIWSAATDDTTPISYSVYRSLSPGGQDFGSPLGTTTDTGYRDDAVINGTTYYYVVRATDGVGNEDDNTIEKSARPRPADLVWGEPLDSDPGWACQGDWAFGEPTGGGSSCGDPTSGKTGGNVYGYNLNGDYTDELGATYLTTGAIDCSGLAWVSLRFWRWLGVESATYDQAAVEISIDGSTWTSVWEHDTGSLCDGAWVQCSYDISAVASGQPTVYIRWRMGPTDYSVTYPGWNIDDIELWGIPDLSSDGSVALNRDAYALPATAYATVRDVDLNANPSVAEQISVEIASTTEATPETVVCTETGADTATFLGSIAIVTGAPSADGQLQVTHGDTMTVSYIDADDGAGGIDVLNTDTATVDALGPIFAGIESATGSDSSVALGWSAATDDSPPILYNIYRSPTSGGQDFGSPLATTTAVGYLDESVANGTAYYYVVRAQDAAGNEESNAVERMARPTGPLVMYSYPLDSDPGWACQGDWAFGQPTGGGSYCGDPTSGKTGANVYGYNLGGNYPNGLGPTYLTSGAIDCFGIHTVSLRFWRWLGVESDYFDEAATEISTDGSMWSSVWEHDSGSFCDGAWVQCSYDISAVADGEPTVYIRWRMGPTDGSVTYPGWNIDDIEIWGIADISSDGDVELDRSVYPAPNQADVEVSDLDLNTNPSAAEQISVEIASTTETTPETVVCTETGPDTATFLGSIAIVTGTPAADGQLQVAHGDTITASYIDADDGAGGIDVLNTDTATVDALGPVFAGIESATGGDGSVTLGWSAATDDSPPILYNIYRCSTSGGHDFGSPLASTTAVGYVDESVVNGIAYYYVVRAEDAAGNEESNSVECMAQPTGPVVLYSYSLDSDPGWARQGDWAFGQPTGGGSHCSDPTSGKTGANVYGYNLNGDYPNNLDPMYLTTGVINCSGISTTSLRFWRWLGVEYDVFDEAAVEISTDGYTWSPVWEHDSGSFCDGAWVQCCYDISAVADGRPAVYIRWRMGPTDSSVTYPGWNIDDIEIWGVRTGFPDVPEDHWGYEYILACVDAGIVGGYPNGTYQPDWAVTRDQMAIYIARALAGGDGNVPAGPPTPTFPDVPATDISYKYIEYAVSNQVVFGYPDTLYHPDYEVDRGTMAIFVARATATPTGEPGMAGYVPPVTPTFADVTPDPLDPYQVCYKYVEYIAAAGVTQGYPDGLYHPEYVVTRGLMAIYVARAFGLL